MPGMRYQPQGLRRIGKSNPLRRGLIFLMPMAGGHDTVDDISGNRATVVGQLETGTFPSGRLALFPGAGAHYLSMPGLPELDETTPATVGWIQQPRAVAAYQSVLQIKVGAANPFLIYQSPSAAAHYFVAGLRGGGQVAYFGNNVGPMQAGRTDSFVLTTENGFGRNGGLSLFRGSEKFSPGSTSSLTSSGATGLLIGHLGGGGDRWRGLLGRIAIWNRVLSDEEARSFNANPWQLFDEDDDDWIAVSEAANYLLPIGGAEFGLTTGQVGMTASRRLRAEPAALAAIDGPVSMRAARRLRAQAATLAIAGGEVSARAARRMSVQPAALDLLVGQVQLAVSRRLGVQPAALALAGHDLAMRAVRRMRVEPAALAVAGQGAALRAGRRLRLAPAALVLTGGQVAMQYSPVLVPGQYTLPVSAAAMTLGGGNVCMRVSRRLVVDPAGLVLAVGAARLLVGRRLVVSPAALATSTGSVGARAARRMRVQAAQLVIAGGNVQLRYSSQIEYARAPAGAGYVPQRVVVTARPVQTGGQRPPTQAGGHRPPAIQETTR